jgi:hypothetical protein
MCDPFATDDFLLLTDAREAADALLDGLRVPVAKALDVASPRGFDLAVARLAAALRRRTAQPEAQALQQALQRLDIDWRGVSPGRRAQLLAQARAAAGRAFATVREAIAVPLERSAGEVVGATRSDLRRRQRLSLAADFNLVDRRAIAYLQRSTALFVRDEYGRRLDRFSERAREVIAQGLEQGLGRDDLAEQLSVAAELTLLRRSRPYWEVVAASFVGEGRSLAPVSAYAEAGIARYVLHAILDEHTTDTCRFLDGKVLPTDGALRTFERLDRASEPLALKNIRPWVRELTGDNGKRSLVVSAPERPLTLAVVERSGMGAKDDRGSYSRALSSQELAPAGVGFPPFHGLCRTTTVAAT